MKKTKVSPVTKLKNKIKDLESNLSTARRNVNYYEEKYNMADAKLAAIKEEREQNRWKVETLESKQGLAAYEEIRYLRDLLMRITVKSTNLPPIERVQITNNPMRGY